MSSYITTEGQTVFDIALAIYGDAAGVSVLLAQNNLNLNGTIATGTSISYDPTIVFKKSIRPIQIPKTPTPPFIARISQSIWDMALQLYGDVSEVYKLLPVVSSLNNDIPVGQSLQPDQNNSYLSNYGNFIYQTSQSGNQVVYLANDAKTVILTTDDGIKILTPA